ncbi:MAG: tRNA lysidine(34) synthetase TilS [Anaerovoracaceae bacterium]|jgi:tRNA(Ile)-lysidine synthase
MMKQSVLETIQQNNLLSPGDHLILGLSGGPDSVCLFDILLSLREELDLTVEAVHVNHCFRPGAAEEDQKYVEELCESRGIRCWSYVVDCNALAEELSMTGEEAGRKARYEAYGRVAGELVDEGVLPDRIKVATAHNRNDQDETLLFRLLRGTGVDGLVGMDYIRRDRLGFLIIRPLLDVSRDRIEQYCRIHGLHPRTDKSNQDRMYTRNRIRMDLIPYLEENYNTNLSSALNRLRLVAKEDRDYLWGVAGSSYEEAFIGHQEDILTLNKDIVKTFEPAIRHRVILHAFEKVGLYKDIGYTHLKAADKLIEKGKSTGQIHFPAGFILNISYGKLEFYAEEDKEVEPLQYKLKASILYKEDYVQKEGTAVFDVDKMAEVYDFAGGPLSLIFARTRQAGDYIALSVGTKTIQDLFVDMKVPKNLRDSIYMAAIGNEILWIPGGVIRDRYSDNFKVTEETRRVLILEMDREL